MFRWALGVWVSPGRVGTICYVSNVAFIAISLPVLYENLTTFSVHFKVPSRIRYINQVHKRGLRWDSDKYRKSKPLV